MVQVRRLMDDDNKKRRRAAKKDFQDTVRDLAAFARKRDPRVAAWRAAEEAVKAQRAAEAEQRCVLGRSANSGLPRIGVLRSPPGAVSGGPLLNSLLSPMASSAEPSTYIGQRIAWLHAHDQRREEDRAARLARAAEYTDAWAQPDAEEDEGGERRG